MRVPGRAGPEGQGSRGCRRRGPAGCGLRSPGRADGRAAPQGRRPRRAVAMARTRRSTRSTRRSTRRSITTRRRRGCRPPRSPSPLPACASPSLSSRSSWGDRSWVPRGEERRGRSLPPPHCHHPPRSNTCPHVPGRAGASAPRSALSLCFPSPAPLTRCLSAASRLSLWSPRPHARPPR